MAATSEEDEPLRPTAVAAAWSPSRAANAWAPASSSAAEALSQEMGEAGAGGGDVDVRCQKTGDVGVQVEIPIDGLSALPLPTRTVAIPDLNSVSGAQYTDLLAEGLFTHNSRRGQVIPLAYLNGMGKMALQYYKP